MTFLMLLMEKDLVLQMITITDDKECYNSQGWLSIHKIMALALRFIYSRMLLFSNGICLSPKL